MYVTIISPPEITIFLTVLYIYLYMYMFHTKILSYCLATYFLHLMSYLLPKVMHAYGSALSFMCCHNLPLYWCHNVRVRNQPLMNLVCIMGRFILPQFFLASYVQVYISWPWLLMIDVRVILSILKF